MNQVIALCHGEVLTPHRKIFDGTVLIADGRIVDYGPAAAVALPQTAQLLTSPATGSVRDLLTRIFTAAGAVT